MKKVFALVFAALICMSALAIGVSAAGSLNDVEANIIEKLSDKVVVGKATYSIPAEYINQAKNYFLTIDVTAEQGEQIVAKIDAGEAIVKAELAKMDGKKVDMSDFALEAKQQLLTLGQEACAVVELNLSYGEGKVTIKKADGTVAFEDEAIVKTTGNGVSYAITGVSFAAVLVAFAVVAGKKASCR